MVIFLAAVLDVPKHLYESAQLDGAGCLHSDALRHDPVDQPGDPVRGRARGDRGPPVLHAGLRRGGVAAGQASQAGGGTLELGYPEGSTLFYPILLYYHGFRFFNMGYAVAMAMLLLVVSFAITPVIIRNSRRWVHYQGRSGERAAAPSAFVRRARRRAVRRRRFLVVVADHSC